MTARTVHITLPHWFCQSCGAYEVVLWYDTSPEPARRRLEKRHAVTGCRGEVEYHAAICPRGLVEGQE